MSGMQAEVAAWATHNFPTDTTETAILGLAEEVGELCRAALKRLQGIRGTHEEWTTELRKELGDVAIKLCHVAVLEGLSLEAPIHGTERAPGTRWREGSPAREVRHLASYVDKQREYEESCPTCGSPVWDGRPLGVDEQADRLVIMTCHDPFHSRGFAVEVIALALSVGGWDKAGVRERAIYRIGAREVLTHLTRAGFRLTSPGTTERLEVGHNMGGHWVPCSGDGCELTAQQRRVWEEIWHE